VKYDGGESINSIWRNAASINGKIKIKYQRKSKYGAAAMSEEGM